MLMMIGVIGVLVSISVPVVGKIVESSRAVKARANAKQVQSVSSALAGMGVAHVLPESLGGVEATIRLLSKGITIPEGPYAGSVFSVSKISEDEIPLAADFLDLIYDYNEIRLVFVEENQALMVGGKLEGPKEKDTSSMSDAPSRQSAFIASHTVE